MINCCSGRLTAPTANRMRSPQRESVLHAHTALDSLSFSQSTLAPPLGVIILITLASFQRSSPFPSTLLPSSLCDLARNGLLLAAYVLKVADCLFVITHHHHHHHYYLTGASVVPSSLLPALPSPAPADRDQTFLQLIASFAAGPNGWQLINPPKESRNSASRETRPDRDLADDFLLRYRANALQSTPSRPHARRPITVFLAVRRPHTSDFRLSNHILSLKAINNRRHTDNKKSQIVSQRASSSSQ